MVRDMYCSMLYVIVCRDENSDFSQHHSVPCLYIYRTFKYYPPRMSTVFFNFILGSRLTTTPFFVFSYAFLNKTTFGIVLGLSDPYVTLRLLPEDLFGKEVKKTETIKSTLFPLFDEQFDL